MIHRKSKGFSLIELLIVIAILGVVSVVALPSFKTMIRGNQVSSGADSLYGVLLYARSEAASRGTHVTIEAPSADEWLSDVVVRTSSETLKEQPGIANLIGDGNASTIVYRPNGTISTNAISITICHRDEALKGKKIEVETSGRVIAPVSIECN